MKAEPDNEALRGELAAVRAELLETQYLMLDSSIDLSVGATVFLDKDGVVLRASRSVEERFLLNPAGLGFDDAFPLYLIDSGDEGEAPARNRFSIRDVLLGATLNGIEAAYTRWDGTSFTLLLVAKPLMHSGGLLNGAVVTMLDLTARKRAEVQLEVRNQQLQYHLALTKTITDNTSEALFLTRLDGRISFMNPAAEKKFGWSAEFLFGKSLLAIVHPHHAQGPGLRDACALCGRNEATLSETREDSFARADGKFLPVRYARSPVMNNGRITGAVFGVTDISEWISSQDALRLSEEKQRQSQKMEAIGRLAGGIAHDFNNLLTAINGYAALGLERLNPCETMREYLEEIRRSGERAAALTSQLLSYSRKQMLVSRVLDLNDIVTDTVSILKRTLGTDIAFLVELHHGPCMVNVDPVHMQQVFVNLAINSRDAMSKGGTLRIKTEPITIPAGGHDGAPGGKASPADDGIPPGDYIQFSISDDGQGMDDIVKAHLFEPFFTTKEIGKGTGLGLSMAYGIVKQHHGQIQAFSETGCGCTIRIWLPSARFAKPLGTAIRARTRLPGGSETILLVDDEEAVLHYLRKVLAGRGYKLLEAVNGLDALALSNRHPGPLDLLVTDVKMRGMDGYELADALKISRPGMPRIFISGYTGDREKPGKGGSFLQKPFGPEALARLVRQELDRALVISP